MNLQVLNLMNIWSDEQIDNITVISTHPKPRKGHLTHLH